MVACSNSRKAVLEMQGVASSHTTFESRDCGVSHVLAANIGKRHPPQSETTV